MTQNEFKLHILNEILNCLELSADSNAVFNADKNEIYIREGNDCCLVKISGTKMRPEKKKILRAQLTKKKDFNKTTKAIQE
jgi:hypothetical protein